MKTMILLAAVASFALATGANAVPQALATKPTTPTKTTTPATPAAKPVAAAKPAAAKAAPAAKTVAGNKVTTTTKTGKKITYDCSKKGNQTKTACKG
jgi:hypothetical protein